MQRKASILICCLIVFLSVHTHGGDLIQPWPIEVELDHADRVVVGKITDINQLRLDPNSRWEYGTATIAVSNTLKGPIANIIEIGVVIDDKSGIGGGSQIPVIRHIGDSSVWIGTHLVPGSSQKDIEQKLDYLAKRKWTSPSNGLEVWVGVFSNSVRKLGPVPRNPQPWLAFAIRNVSDHDIYCPFNALAGKAVGETGQTFSARSVGLLTGISDASCAKLSPGSIRYLRNEFFQSCFKEAAPGKYKVSFIYENSLDIVCAPAIKPGEPPIQAWKGTLEPPPIEIEYDPKYNFRRAKYFISRLLLPACAFGGQGV
jgi:hypothetical protein